MQVGTAIAAVASVDGTMINPDAQQPDRPLSDAERQALRSLAARLACTDPVLAERLDNPPHWRGVATGLLLGAVLAMVLFTALESVLSAVVVGVLLGRCAWLLGRHLDQLLRQRRP